jgi:hypothetical protein
VAATEKRLVAPFEESAVVKQVKIADLKVDRSYQRDVSMNLVEEIAYNWDEVASELILVSNRGEREDPDDSGFFIVNGQHRTTAARKLNLPKIWARIIDLSEYENPAAIEAGLRLKTNVRMGDRALERFKAQLIAGDEDSLAIVKILAKFDCEINSVPDADTGINTVSSVEALYRVDQGGILIETLQMVKDVYGFVGGRQTTSNLLKGIAWFILKHSQESDRERLVKLLRTTGHAALDRKARTIQAVMGASLWANYYRSIVEIYNEKLTDKHRLEWALRGSTTFKGGSRVSFGEERKYRGVAGG